MNKLSLRLYLGLSLLCMYVISCKKSGDAGMQTITQPTLPVTMKAIYLNDVSFNNTVYAINNMPVIKIQFSLPVLQSSLATAVTLSNGATTIPISASLQNNDSVLVIQPAASLAYSYQIYFWH